MEVNITEVEGVQLSVKARTYTTCDQPQDNGGADAGMTPPDSSGFARRYVAFYAAEYLRTRKLASSGVTVSVAAES